MMQVISMRQLEQYLVSGQAMTLLDVRDRGAFAEGHLRGAVNIPVEELEYRAGELDRGRMVVVYCAHGSNSLMAARTLDRMGFRVAAASGGLAYYRGGFMSGRLGWREKAFDRE